MCISGVVIECENKTSKFKADLISDLMQQSNFFSPHKDPDTQGFKTSFTQI